MIPFLVEKYSLQEAYNAGLDCGIHGANTRNCNFAIFATKQHTQEWERGKKDGECKAKGK